MERPRSLAIVVPRSHTGVVDPSHFEGLYRQRDEASEVARSPIGRSLDVYADAVGGGQ